MSEGWGGSVRARRERRTRTMPSPRPPPTRWKRVARAACCLLLMLAAASPAKRARAQELELPPAVAPPPHPATASVKVVPGPEYQAGSARRWLLGAGHRDLWTTAITVPVLDPETFRGGLRPVRVGGGMQTLTLHLRDREGRYYLFRSVNKRMYRSLPEDLRDTSAGLVIQDLTAVFHPLGALVAPVLEEAVGLPHTWPAVYVMAASPALGEHAETFAGMLGILVESPDHGEHHELHFMGSDEVLGSDDLLERLRASPAHRVDAEALLEARLLDLVIGDPDRGFPQWRWLRHGPDGAWTWTGVPMDRDMAFVMRDGVAGAVARTAARRYVRFEHEIDVFGLSDGHREFDRLLLIELERSDWDRVATRVQVALTDRVIDDAVASLPREFQSLAPGSLAERLRARRDELPDAALRFYGLLAGEVDVQGTDADEVTLIERRPDGTLEVSLFGPRAAHPVTAQGWGAPPGRYYHRRFLPEETSEVRVYLRGGADRAVVRGSGSPITVRVIGGAGNDLLADSARESSRTVFYDQEGENRFVTGPGTRVYRSSWEQTATTEYRALVQEMLADIVEENRDWGGTGRVHLRAGYRDRVGVILGAGLTRTDYGFRRLPFHRQLGVTGLVGTGSGGLGLASDARLQLRNPEHSMRSALELSWKLASVRFHGYGNDSPEEPDDSDLSLADEARWDASLEARSGEKLRLSLGPLVRYVEPRVDAGSALDRLRPLGWDGFGEVGVRAALEVDATDGAALPRNGVAVRAETATYLPLWDATEWFGRAGAGIEGYLPVGATTLALRTGGERSWGAPPFFEAASVGGGATLRGFRSSRFIGDWAAYLGAEWRIPLGQLRLLTRGRVGTFALTDFGRVWSDGDSPGGWHNGSGIGFWYETMGVAGTVAWAKGEEGRIYLTVSRPRGWGGFGLSGRK